MQIKDYLIVMVIIGILAYAIGGSIFVLNREYNTEAVNVSVIDGMANDLDSLNSNVNSTYGIVAQPNSVSAGGVFGIIFNSIGNFLLSIFNIVTLPFKWVATIGTTFGIPSAITTGVVTLLLIGITIAVVTIILRRTP